jgi:hypothetical protein
LSWFPTAGLETLHVKRVNARRFRQANGTILDRWTGGVIVRVAGVQTWDEVVFGDPVDLTLPGAHSLEGLNLRIDPVTKQLIDAGPAPRLQQVSGSSWLLRRDVDRDRRIGRQLLVNRPGSIDDTETLV